MDEPRDVPREGEVWSLHVPWATPSERSYLILGASFPRAEHHFSALRLEDLDDVRRAGQVVRVWTHDMVGRIS